MPKILHLTLKKKWFDMILSGEKKEEYREIKPYWEKRLWREFYADNGLMVDIYGRDSSIHFDVIKLKNGYAKDAPMMTLKCKGISIGKCKGDWSDMAIEDHFIIGLGKILETKNIPLPVKAVGEKKNK